MILFRNVCVRPSWLMAVVEFSVFYCLLGSAFALSPTLPNRGTTTKKASIKTTNLHAVSGKDHKLSQPNLVRGEYYKNAASTLPSPEVIAAQLGVKPTKEASNKTWKRAWTLHKKLIPLLHSTDSCKPPDSSLNLACMWWKGLAGNDRSSPVCDDGLAYDLLPSGWRKLIRPARLYPRLHHGNVELRTAYLDQQVTAIANSVNNNNNKEHQNSTTSTTTHIQLVCMGAGYDTRGVKMIERATVDEVVELDLPGVVDAKERLFQRLIKRRPWLKDLSMPTLIPSDFNDLEDVEEKLRRILSQNSAGDDTTSSTTSTTTERHIIFVFEGVMIYLDEGVPSALLEITSKLLREHHLRGSLCFADRLENVPGGDYDLGVQELQTNGWDLKDWSPKPGLARHMGSANLLSASETKGREESS